MRLPDILRRAEELYADSELGSLAALEQAGVPSVQLQYAENSADFGAVREQAGTFADALRLWEGGSKEQRPRE